MIFIHHKRIYNQFLIFIILIIVCNCSKESDDKNCPTKIIVSDTIISSFVMDPYDFGYYVENFYDTALTFIDIFIDVDDDSIPDFQIKDYHKFMLDGHWFATNIIGLRENQLIVKDFENNGLMNYYFSLFNKGDLILVDKVFTKRSLNGNYWGTPETNGFVTINNSIQYIGFIKDLKIGWIEVLYDSLDNFKINKWAYNNCPEIGIKAGY